MNPSTATGVDEYIAGFPDAVQAALREVRLTIRQLVPDATEAIKYAMPTFIYHGNLVHYAAFKNHIGFYPAPTGVPSFKKKLAGYKTGKGSVQFPLDKPMPVSLIRDIVQARVHDVLKKPVEKKAAASR